MLSGNSHLLLKVRDLKLQPDLLRLEVSQQAQVRHGAVSHGLHRENKNQARRWLESLCLCDQHDSRSCLERSHSALCLPELGIHGILQQMQIEKVSTTLSCSQSEISNEAATLH